MPEPGFVIIQYGKKQFEKFGCTIYKFSKDFLHRNGARRLPVTRQEVNWHWEQQIMKTYSKSDDPMRVFLLEQVRHWYSAQCTRWISRNLTFHGALGIVSNH